MCVLQDNYNEVNIKTKESTNIHCTTQIKKQCTTLIKINQVYHHAYIGSFGLPAGSPKSPKI